MKYRRESAKALRLMALALLGPAFMCFASNLERETLIGSRPTIVPALAASGRLPATNVLSLTIGLPLQNQPALDELLRQLYDPASTNFHKFLTPPEFTARFGPSEEHYEAVIKFVERNGLAVVRRYPNRVVLDVEGSVRNLEE